MANRPRPGEVLGEDPPDHPGGPGVGFQLVQALAVGGLGGDRHSVARCPGPGCELVLNLLPVQEDLLNRHAGQVREQDVGSLKIAGPE